MAVIITAIRANCHCCKQITLVEPAFPECRLSAESIFFESKFSIRLAFCLNGIIIGFRSSFQKPVRDMFAGSKIPVAFFCSNEN
ncbi:hypothetical protein D918_04238 [Trichuris suis]|nr:hypothetical protein D918_04238 [Trichuris suis]